MKKPMINTAASIAIASAVFSAFVLTTQAYASDISSDISSELNSVDNNSSNSKTTETYMLPGIGTGAATGAIMAGPVGLLVGGMIGAFIGASQNIDQADTAIPADNVVSMLPVQPSTNVKDAELSAPEKSIQLAQIGAINPIADEAIDSTQEKLMNILVTDLSLDVYFRTGSTDIEKFYPARLTAIADLINTMDKLELHLDGYTDRRGNKTENIALAEQRIEKVRQQLINAGVEENRIISNALGEIKMVSPVGDLEAYTFDRKVVIRFERTRTDMSHSNTKAISSLETEEAMASSSTNDNTSPLLANAASRF